MKKENTNNAVNVLKFNSKAELEEQKKTEKSKKNVLAAAKKIKW